MYTVRLERRFSIGSDVWSRRLARRAITPGILQEKGRFLEPGGEPVSKTIVHVRSPLRNRAGFYPRKTRTEHLLGLRNGPANFFPLLASFASFGSFRFATPHRPGGTGVIEGAVIPGLGAGAVE